MKHLPFPFDANIVLQIKTGKKKEQLVCELAASTIEIYQSLNYRSKKDFKIPLVLQFESSIVQSLSLQNFSFPVEQICIDYRDGKAKKAGLIRPAKTPGKFIHGYSEFSLVILAPVGTIKKLGITVDLTVCTVY
ncbi:MAG: hypothetical protein WCO28_12325 [Bacteroidota bacterium]